MGCCLFISGLISEAVDIFSETETVGGRSLSLVVFKKHPVVRRATLR